MYNFFLKYTFSTHTHKKVITEVWQPTRAGAYSVEGVLNIMVRGLDDELQARMAGELGGSKGSSAEFPLPPILTEDEVQSPILESSAIMNEEDDARQSKRRRVKNWIKNRIKPRSSI